MNTARTEAAVLPLTMRHFHRRVLGAAGTVGVGLALVKGAGAAKELLVARQFGSSDVVDAFLIAFAIPSFAINVIAGSLPAALIPAYVRLQASHGVAAADALARAAIRRVTALLIGVALLLALGAPWILPHLGAAFSASKLALTYRLFYTMLPVIVIGGIANAYASILNANHRFATAALAGIATPVVTAFLIIVFHGWGAYGLAAGALIGACLEAAWVARAARRKAPETANAHALTRDALRSATRQYVPMVAGALLLTSASLVDQAMAAALPAGSVARLSYGSRLILPFVTMTAAVIGTSLIPNLSELSAHNRWRELRRVTTQYAALIGLAAVPVAFAIGALSRPIVVMLFQHGAFKPEDSREVSRVQAALALLIPFYLVGMLYVRALSAVLANHVLMWGALISLILNIWLNYVLMHRMGVSGIALSTSIVYVASACYLYICFNRILRRREAHADAR